MAVDIEKKCLRLVFTALGFIYGGCTYTRPTEGDERCPFWTLGFPGCRGSENDSSCMQALITRVLATAGTALNFTGTV